LSLFNQWPDNQPIETKEEIAMLKAQESPLLTGMFFVIDEDGEVKAGPFFYAAEAHEAKEDLENDQD
jgi:hypothetical protein